MGPRTMGPRATVPLAIGPGFRDRMGWLHTWAGVLVGALLFAIFWMGSLSVFDKEIDRWMIPETRIVPTGTPVSYDALIRPALSVAGGAAAYLNFLAPDEREPTVKFYYQDTDGTFHAAHLDPRTGAPLDLTDSLAGTGFIFPFHYGLHITWYDLGYWIVGFAGMSMLVLLVSGLFIHRKIIAEFFIFRPRKNPRRSTLDLHNLTSLIGLPFYILISFSGLLIFFTIYFPWAIQQPFGGDDTLMARELFGAYPVAVTGEPGTLGSVDAMIGHAERTWSARAGTPVQADVIRILNYGDAGASVYLRNTFPRRRVTLSEHIMVMDGATGRVLSDYSAPPVKRVFAWIEGAHFVQFGHWPLRWLYFAAGLSGCVMIATGLLFWIRARVRKGVGAPVKVRAVRAVAVGAVTGLMAATGAFLVANRLLPKGAALLGQDRSELEIWVFFLVWAGTFVHAVLRGQAAWREQTCLLAGLAFSAALLNGITTGDHLAATIARGYWPVAGLDLMLLTVAAVALAAARRLGRAPAPLPAPKVTTAQSPGTAPAE
ncbi:PepSY-associated TM helix domain-containing protein [Eilatimonas milleporae]|nr:PepSY-associated TM helix domain-containing protein [Eilatimonas milleporae]